MTVITETAMAAHERLIVPVFQKLMEQRVSVHSQRATDTLHTAEVGLAGSLNVKGHPVTHAAQEGHPRFIFVQNLQGYRQQTDKQIYKCEERYWCLVLI